MHKPTDFSSRQAYKALLPPMDQGTRDVLYGMLLGDAHARLGPRKREASVEFVHGSEQRAFVDHLFGIFEPYTWFSGPREYSRGERCSYGFNTFSWSPFTRVHEAFYIPATVPGRRFIRRIPPNMEEWFNARVFAYHIMSDGSMAGRNLRLWAFGFTADELRTYARVCNEVLGLYSSVRWRRKGGSYLVFPVKDLPRLQELLLPIIPPFFHYKLGIGTYKASVEALRGEAPRLRLFSSIGRVLVL